MNSVLREELQKTAQLIRSDRMVQVRLLVLAATVVLAIAVIVYVTVR